MVKIIMHGCCGHMGQVISDLVAKDANAEIVAGIDVTDKGNTDLVNCQVLNEKEYHEAEEIRYLPILKNVRQRQMS